MEGCRRRHDARDGATMVNPPWRSAPVNRGAIRVWLASLSRFGFLAALVSGLASAGASAGEYPAPRQGEWVARDFRFHDGEVLPELRLRYLTVGDPSGEPVLILHGTGASAASMFLNDDYAGQLFGPGQPLDATKYFLILPDEIGHGGSSKPSDGLKTKFPKYDYDDMIDADHKLLTEGLGVRHLRLVTGQSMGGMETWLWGEKYPDFMDALVPMAAQPTAMASRNWMLRRLLIENVRNDPEWKNGDYETEPRSMRLASALYGVATNGGTLRYQHLAPTREKADALVDKLLARPFNADANDFIYQLQASADYDPAPNLERIEAAVLAINSADDERNPVETGVTQDAMKRVKNGRLYLIPASEETRGHSTPEEAKLYAHELRALLESASRRNK
jgi:homoserine O-acetyltransferase